MTSDLNRASKRAKDSPMAEQDGAGRGFLAERPRDTFKDARDSMERAYHESRLAPTYRERVSHIVDFIYDGLALPSRRGAAI